MNSSSKTKSKHSANSGIMSEPTPVKSKSRKAFSFAVYSKIFPNQLNVPLWAMLNVPAAVCVIIYFVDDETRALYAAILCTTVFLLRWGIEFLRKIATYGAYKNFSATLGFALQGWEKVGAYTNQLKFRHWSHETVVQVFVFEHATQSEIAQVKKVLDVFMAKSGRHFYYRDHKTNWQYHGSLRIQGSSDANVIGDIYVLINEQFRLLQEKTKIIREVMVKFDPKIEKEEPPMSADTMS